MAVLMFADIVVASKVATIDDYYDVFAIVRRIPKEEIRKQDKFEGYTFTVKELLDHWDWWYSLRPFLFERGTVTESSVADYLQHNECFENKGNGLFGLSDKYVEQLMSGNRNIVMKSIMEHKYDVDVIKELDIETAEGYNWIKQFA